jgi:hypothetical protein
MNRIIRWCKGKGLQVQKYDCSLYFVLPVIRQNYRFSLEFICKLYICYYKYLKKSIKMICEKFPKITVTSGMLSRVVW